MKTRIITNEEFLAAAKKRAERTTNARAALEELGRHDDIMAIRVKVSSEWKVGPPPYSKSSEMNEQSSWLFQEVRARIVIVLFRVRRY